MRRMAAFVMACSCALSQSSAPAASPQSDASPGFVVRISVNLVQVDAAVTDSKGKPVTDLKADDFEVLQDGAAQKVVNLSYITEGVKLAPPVPAPAKGARPVVPPPVSLKPGQVRRVIALVVDDLGLSPASVAQVRSGLKKFVDHDIQPGDLVAVVRTGGGVGALQQFTTDKRLLYASIDRLRYNFNGRVGSFTPINPAPALDTSQTLTLPAQAASASNGLTQPASGTSSTAMNGLQGASVSSLISDPDDACSLGTGSAVGSLAAVRYVVQGLRDLPGRKALVLFSESMQMFEPPGVITTRPFVKGMTSGSGESSNSWTCDYSRVRDSFHKLTDAAERAAVVIYTVDPRGVDPVMFDVADNPLQNAHSMADASGASLPRQLGQKSEQYRASQEGLHALAEDTGGTFAVHNDMLGAIREAAEDSSNYYLIGYRPPANSFDEKSGQKFHKIEVHVKRSGLKVRSRNGFFGFPGRERSAPAFTREEQFARVLVSPFAVNDIHVRMTTLFSHSDQSFLSTLLYIDGKDLTFTQEPDGSYKAVLDAVAITFDEDGHSVNDTQKTFTLHGSEHGRDMAVKNGLILTLQHAAEKPGPYQLRVAVRDASSKKMGAASQFVEVPDLKHNHLAVSGILMKQQDAAPGKQSAYATQSVALDPKGNEAIRIFKPGENVGWEFQIFNAHKGPSEKPDVTVETRIFREGSEIARSEPVPVSFPNNVPLTQLAASGKMVLSSKFLPGDYALQVVVTDNLAKKKNAIASQSIDFTVDAQ
ncbi:MAG TPA: VWA domain-containing protein [Candidatus Dormibacteraeota bacterium]|nr:VWA domain-containing protein [Candidatus Dormibacteraeota bacterium]